MSHAPVMFDYRDAPALAASGMDWMLEGSSEQPGYSCFLRERGQIFHTYSTFARGTEQLGGAYAFLDTTALGRQEEWEQPKGPVGRGSRGHAGLRQLNLFDVGR